MAAASAGLLVLSFAGPAQAVDTLDRAVPDNLSIVPQSSTSFHMQQMAETFTPSFGGDLDRVTLYVGSGNFTLPKFRLDVYQVDPGSGSLTPIGTTFESYQLQLLQTHSGWEDFGLSPTVPVQKGNQYALVVTAVSFPLVLNWYYMTNWPYAGSNMWIGSPLAKDTFNRNFAFRTYISGAAPTPTPSPVVNTPPTLDPPVTSAVQTPEGSAPTNTGNYSDPDRGDTVHLSASVGSLKWTGTNNGAWTWTGTAADEDVPTQTVTITANDGHNADVTRTFTVSFYAVKPTVTVAPTGGAGPTLAAATAIKEGTPLSFSGSAQTPVAADAAGLQYAWSVTKDGASYPTAASSSASFSFTPKDEGDYVITMTATDDGNQTGSGSFSVTVGDVLPTAVITGYTAALSAPKIILPYELITFSGTFNDPGTDDPHTATWDFGDGSPTASGWTVAHFYTKPGAYPVTLTVAQGEDPGVGSTTMTLTVMTPAQALGAIGGYVQTLPGLNNGQKNSLIAKLNAASDSAARGNTTAATNQLNAFLNELAADEQTGKVTSAEAANLEADLLAVKGALGNSNRLLDFWPLGL